MKSTILVALIAQAMNIVPVETKADVQASFNETTYGPVSGPVGSYHPTPGSVMVPGPVSSETAKESTSILDTTIRMAYTPFAFFFALALILSTGNS